jgi:hypothetical protein
MNRTILACTMAAFSMSAPAFAGSQGASASSSHGTYDRPAGHYSMSGSQIQRIDRAPSDAMTELSDAAQRLRESIQEIARHAPGKERDAAIRSAHQALFDTQQAIIQLPPELRRGNSQQAVSEQDFQRSMAKLKAAAQSLRESAQAMAQQPAGARRNQAVDRVNEAILEINQAMVQLPLERSWTRSAHVDPDAGQRQSASTSSTFDAIDTNSDGMLSRDEYRSHVGEAGMNDGQASRPADQVSTPPDRDASASTSADRAARRSDAASATHQASR